MVRVPRSEESWFDVSRLSFESAVDRASMLGQFSVFTRHENKAKPPRHLWKLG